MSCPHVAQANLKPPTATQAVHREDCTQCFDSIDDALGLDVCLSCFNGGCLGERNHAALHHALTEHPLVLNIRRTKKPQPEREEPPQKMTKLAIAAETEADRHDTATIVKCYACDNMDVDRFTGNLPGVIDGVMSALTFAKQTDVAAWELEINPCEHILTLQQDQKDASSTDLTKCGNCDLKENLWMCLQCGNLGCGRAQYGGVGGNSHGVAHFEASQHPVSVKLGSITPEGTADCYCYKCQDEVKDPELAFHLTHWGINIADRKKTEKSVTEMNIEQNLNWDFRMTSEDGKELKPLFGSGLTGLKNLGNSCYMASILQCLFSLPEFEARYYGSVKDDAPVTVNPAEDLETQLRKVADGLLSGRYSVPDDIPTSTTEGLEVRYQKGIAPGMFKALIGRGHEEFSTMRQQDAFELQLHLFKLISRSAHPAPLEDPVSAFKFVLEQRLQCLSCKRVRYRTDEQDNISVPVPARRIKSDAPAAEGEGKKDDKFEPVTLKECLDIFTSNEVVEFTCKSCGGKDGATKKSGFKTFPRVLTINARRFEVINWVPTKLDIPVIVDDTPFTLDQYMSRGLQPGEEELPEDAESSSKPSFEPNPESMMQLEGMGFPRPRCIRALYNTGNGDAETAMNWLFGHMDDPDIDAPLELPQSSGGGGGSAAATFDPEQMGMLTAMGFTELQAKKALRETGSNVERAVDWLFNHPDETGEEEIGGGDGGSSSGADAAATADKKVPGSDKTPANFRLHSIVCHKGASIHAGHYVAFIRKQIPDADGNKKEGWVLFNDEKVVEGADVDEMKKFAYVYFFERL